MTATVSDIISAMQFLSPDALAEDWDNVGLQVGNSDWPVQAVWVALDPLPPVVAAACRQGVHMLITHHPLIFRPIRAIDTATATGTVIAQAVRHRLTLYASHTNLDSVAGGINDALAGRIGLVDTAALAPAPDPGDRSAAAGSDISGMGRIGRLPDPLTLDDLGRRIKSQLPLDGIRVAGDPGLTVSTVAVCSGSGSGLMDRFMVSGAQVFVSGDLHYHDARSAEAAGLGLIDIGHFGSEHLIVDVLADGLRRVLTDRGFEVDVQACRLERDPFRPL
jgi:dinuclear metal center YbgI/SA1388 family protein